MSATKRQLAFTPSASKPVRPLSPPPTVSKSSEIPARATEAYREWAAEHVETLKVERKELIQKIDEAAQNRQESVVKKGLLVNNADYNKEVDKELSTDRARVQKSARSNEAHPVNAEKVNNGATKDAKRARGDGHFGASSANLKTVSEGGLKDSRKSPGVGPFGAPPVDPKKVNRGGLKETHKTPYRNSY